VEKETGGPAFPTDFIQHPQDGDILMDANSGMTLRDFFAAAALTGLIAKEGVGGEAEAGEDAARAYMYADAMVEARKK
jgi:hypothetical protein